MNSRPEPPLEPTGLLMTVVVIGMVIFAAMAGYAVFAVYI